MNYLNFELRRFIKNPKNRICLVLLSTFFFGLFFMNQTVFHKTSMESDLTIAKLNLQQSSQTVTYLKQQSQLYPDDEDLLQNLTTAQKEEEILSEQVAALEVQDYEKYVYLGYQLNVSAIGTIMEKDSDEYRFLDAQIRYYEAVKEVKGTSSPIINETSESAFFTGRSMTSWLSSTVVFILIAVLIADSVSSEIESSQIRLYHLLGGRKFKHLLVKLCVPILVTFVVTIFTFFIIYLVKGLIDSFGTWNYPYLVEDGSIQPIWQITLATLVLYLFTLIFIGSLGQLLSLIFKKSLVVIGLIAVFLTGFMTLAQEEWFQPYKMFFPFEYMGFGQLLNDVLVLPKNAFAIGNLYLFGLSLVFIIISGYLYWNYHYRKVVKL